MERDLRIRWYDGDTSSRREVLVNKIELGGPCNGQVTFQLDGIIVAPEGNPYSDCWFTFQGVDNLNIQGSGMFDGNGPSAWEHCPVCAATVGFYGTNNAHIQDITSLNSEGFHFLIDGVDGMTFENINITAPGNSPNTDGINMENANNIQILDSNIGTGDDCVAIGQGSTNINVTGGDSKVQISNVKYIGVTGTSASPVAVDLQCSNSMPCQDIYLENIDLSLTGGGQTSSSCANVNPTYSGTQNPAPCSQ
ncbi:hypothetical protein AG4045_006826 [Apium graveolens]|uniref:Polygalacturonase n=1 Tax=Apium graveolens TaxID=4045 RepID=A0A6L5BBI5_APIGR|nr:hypothetical protein AG4045_006826 [Apium graveolens]